MSNIENENVKNILRIDFLQHRFSQYRAQQSVHLTALRRWLAVSVFLNAALLSVVAFIIGGR